MFAPIYLPPAGPVPASVLAAIRASERAILVAEGPHHVAGRYIANERLAADQRRIAAESIVETAHRLVALSTPIASVSAVRSATLDGAAAAARRAA